MRVLAFFVAAALLSGCISQQAPKETHFVSSNVNLKGCNNSTTVGDREACYVEAAVSKTSPQLCAEVGSLKQRNACYHRLAVKLLDPIICQNIREDDEKQTTCLISATV
jgi:hypothetical protein